MDRYPPIADHGLVGDLQTVALISSRGVVDWLAAPRFDSPSVFAALLDHERGGFFRVAPEGGTHTCKQLYYPDRAVVVTRFMAPEGIGEALDWMTPIRSGGPTGTPSSAPYVRYAARALRPGSAAPVRLRPCRPRQRRRRPAPARHLRRSPLRAVRGPRGGHSGGPPGMEDPLPHPGPARGLLGPPRRRHLGDPRRARTSPTAG